MSCARRTPRRWRASTYPWVGEKNGVLEGAIKKMHIDESSCAQVQVRNLSATEHRLQL